MGPQQRPARPVPTGKSTLAGHARESSDSEPQAPPPPDALTVRWARLWEGHAPRTLRSSAWPCVAGGGASRPTRWVGLVRRRPLSLWRAWL